MRTLRHVRLLMPLAAALLLTGCDLFGSPDTTMVLSGRVIANGEPVAGLGVTLDEGLTFGQAPVARTMTDNTGAFTIMHEPGHIHTLRTLVVSNEPYDSRYSVYSDGFVRGTRLDLGDIDLTLPPARPDVR